MRGSSFSIVSRSVPENANEVIFSPLYSNRFQQFGVSVNIQLSFIQDRRDKNWLNYTGWAHVFKLLGGVIDSSLLAPCASLETPAWLGLVNGPGTRKEANAVDLDQVA